MCARFDHLHSHSSEDRGFVAIGCHIHRDSCGLTKLLDCGPWLSEFIKHLSGGSLMTNVLMIHPLIFSVKNKCTPRAACPTLKLNSSTISSQLQKKFKKMDWMLSEIQDNYLSNGRLSIKYMLCKEPLSGLLETTAYNY